MLANPRLSISLSVSRIVPTVACRTSMSTSALAGVRITLCSSSKSVTSEYIRALCGLTSSLAYRHRITYKLCLTTWKTLHTYQPLYLSALISHYLPPRSFQYKSPYQTSRYYYQLFLSCLFCVCSFYLELFNSRNHSGLLCPCRRGDIKRYRDPSVCLSVPAQAIGTLAACSWPTTRDMQTADPSADGRRSAGSRIAIGGGTPSRRPRAITCHCLIFAPNKYIDLVQPVRSRAAHGEPLSVDSLLTPLPGRFWQT